MSVSVEKGNHGRSHHTAHAMRHLKNNCAEDVCGSEKDSLKAVELKENKHEEEATEIVEKSHIEKGAEAVMKKSKSDRETHAQQKLPSIMSCQDDYFSTMANCVLCFSSHLSFENVEVVH